MAYNTVAEIQGTDRNGEIVMVGAQLDSWQPEAARRTCRRLRVVMEAVRILQASGSSRSADPHRPVERARSRGYGICLRDRALRLLVRTEDP